MKEIEDVRRYLYNPEAIYVVGGQYKDMFLESLDTIEKQIKLVDEGKEEKLDINKIMDCIKYINNLLIDKKLEEISKQFVRNYLYLVYNINENIYKDKKLNGKIVFLQRFIDNELRFEESIQIIQMCNKKLRHLGKKVPASFKLSRHYFDLIEDK